MHVPAWCSTTEAGFSLSILHYYVQQFQQPVPISYNGVQQFTFGAVGVDETRRHFPNTPLEDAQNRRQHDC